MLINEVSTISSFKELLNEICWSWEYPRYQIIKYKDGNYSLNKLYIEPDRVSYKTDNWVLAPGVFKEFEEFVEFLERTDHEITNKESI